MAHETLLRSPRRGWTLLVTVALAAALITGMVPGIPAPAARADDVTASQNDLRNGWDQGETGLTPAVLASGTFGQLFSTPVDGQVYAQPVVVGNTVIVATENDWIYGLNSATGAIEWSRQLGAPWPSSAENCSDLEPNVGVTGTPVYNPATGTVYMVSQEVPAGNSVYNPEFLMHAINPQTGAERPGWPVPIQGSPANDPGRPFNPFTELQRPGLLLLGGSVYAAFGSHCDFTPYAGYVAGVNTSTRALTLWSDEAGLTDNQGGIWQSGGGLMSDGPGRIFLATGNGHQPAPGTGRRGGPARRAEQRDTPGQGLLQPGQRAEPGRHRHRLRGGRPGWPSVRQQRLSALAGPGGQGWPALRAERRRSGRPRAGPRRHR